MVLRNRLRISWNDTIILECWFITNEYGNSETGENLLSWNLPGTNERKTRNIWDGIFDLSAEIRTRALTDTKWACWLLDRDAAFDTIASSIVCNRYQCNLMPRERGQYADWQNNLVWRTRGDSLKRSPSRSILAWSYRTGKVAFRVWSWSGRGSLFNICRVQMFQSDWLAIP